MAIELFTAAQALDFRKHLKRGDGAEKAHQIIRNAIPHTTKDHYVKDDINMTIDLIRNRKLTLSLDKVDKNLH